MLQVEGFAGAQKNCHPGAGTRPGELPPSVAASIPWVPMKGFHFSPQRTAPTTTAICPNVLHMSISHEHTFLCISITRSHAAKKKWAETVYRLWDKNQTSLCGLQGPANQSLSTSLSPRATKPIPNYTKLQWSPFHFRQAVFFCLRAGALGFFPLPEMP